MAKKGKTVTLTLLLCIMITSLSITTIQASVSPPFKFVTPWVWDTPPNLTIESPTNGTYTGSVVLNFTVEAPSYWFNNQSVYWNNFNSEKIEQKLKSVIYVLDGYSATIPVDSNLCLPYKDSIDLANLTEGTHQLIVYTNATGVYRSFRDFFAQTQINDPNRTVIVFNFTPASTPSPPSRNPAQPEPIDYLLPISVVFASIIVSFVLYRRHRKISQSPLFPK